MKLIRRMRSSMSVNVIGGLVFLILLFGLVVGIIGNRSITWAFKKEYASVTSHMADTVASLINGDHLEEYLEGKETEEYAQTKELLELFCERLNVSLIYLIKVDRSDYGRFVSIFNSVNNTVDNSSYTPWELGYERDTTNEEYRQKYRAIYEQEVPYETVFRMHTTDGQFPHITTLFPVKDSSGEVQAILCIQRPIREMSELFRPYFFFSMLCIFLMASTISLAASLFLRKSIIQPVKKVSAEAVRFAKENAKGEPLGKISRYEVLDKLAGSIDSMETEMEQYIENLTAITAEKERISAELSIAATIQKGSLPDAVSVFKDRKEFEISAAMDPAKEVGGDFYNFFLIDDDHLALVMADVSDKGIPAALFMMVTNILISDRAQMGGTPAEILGFVNDNVCAHNRAEMFVTVWLGILEISTGILTYASAGHEYPALYHNNGSFEILKAKQGFVLGGMEGMRYYDHVIKMGKGDKLFLYTDGLPDATNMENHMFSIDRMVETLNANKDKSPLGILKGVRKTVNDFVGEASQFDDLTMLCIEILEEIQKPSGN